MRRRSGHISQDHSLVHEDRRLSWRVREALEQGATVDGKPGSGSATTSKEDIRSGLFCGSIYWVLLVSGRVSVPKPLSQIQRSTL